MQSLTLLCEKNKAVFCSVSSLYIHFFFFSFFLVACPMHPTTTFLNPTSTPLRIILSVSQPLFLFFSFFFSAFFPFWVCFCFLLKMPPTPLSVCLSPTPPPPPPPPLCDLSALPDLLFRLLKKYFCLFCLFSFRLSAGKFGFGAQPKTRVVY